MSDYEVRFEVTVQLRVNDQNAIDRVVQNQDDAGNPQPFGRGNGNDGWQDNLYYFSELAEKAERGAVEMLARCLGVKEWRLDMMDGWADMDEGAVEVIGSPEVECWSIERDGVFL